MGKHNLDDLMYAIDCLLLAVETADCHEVLRGRLWSLGSDMHANYQDEPALRAFGLQLQLEALLRRPEIMQATVQEFYGRLVAMAPTVDSLVDEVRRAA